MQGHQTFHDGESETGALVATLTGRAGLEEGIADALEIVGRDAHSGVGHAKHQVRSLHLSRNRYPAATLGELDGIGYEVEHDLLEGARVAGQCWQVLRRICDEIDAVFPRFQCDQIAAIDQGRTRRERFRRDFEIAGFHLGHVENTVDHTQQVLTGIVDELGILLATCGVQHQCLFPGDHFGEADDRIQRRAQFMAHDGEETRLGGVRCFRGTARKFKRLLLELALRDVTHRGDDLGFARDRHGRGSIQRPAAHLDPDEIGGPVRTIFSIPFQAKFDAACLAALRGLGQRRQIGRTIGDVDAIEKAVLEQMRGRRSHHGFRRRRDELDRAVAPMAGDHIAHVEGQQAVAAFFARHEFDAGARQRLRAERKTCRVESCGSHAHRHQHGLPRRLAVQVRQHAEMAERDQQRCAGKGQQASQDDHAARGRQRRFQGNDDQPDRGKGRDAAGGHGHRHNKAGKRRRRQHMRALVAARARQKPGQQDRRNQPGKRRNLDHARHAAQRKKDREGRESNQAAKQPGCHESTMARTGQRIMARRWVQQCIEAVADHVQNSHGSRASALSSTRRAGNAPPSCASVSE